MRDKLKEEMTNRVLECLWEFPKNLGKDEFIKYAKQYLETKKGVKDTVDLHIVSIRDFIIRYEFEPQRKREEVIIKAINREQALETFKLLYPRELYWSQVHEC